MVPERRFGWLHRAQSLDKLGRTAEAKDVLLSAQEKFEKNATIPFHLARYCSKLGQLLEAKQWLGKALLAADGPEEVKRLHKLALEDPDLEPLRRLP